MPRRSGKRQVAATSTVVERESRIKRGPKWGYLVVALLCSAVLSYVGYSRGLFDGLLAQPTEVEEPGTAVDPLPERPEKDRASAHPARSYGDRARARNSTADGYRRNSVPYGFNHGICTRA